MEGVAGLRGWRWIFIIEGLITTGLGVIGYVVIVDFPDKVHLSKRPFLNSDELQILKERLNADRGDAEFDKITPKAVGKVLITVHPVGYGLFRRRGIFTLRTALRCKYPVFIGCGLVRRQDACARAVRGFPSCYLSSGFNDYSLPPQQRCQIFRYFPWICGLQWEHFNHFSMAS